MCPEFIVDYLQITFKPRDCSTIMHIRDTWNESSITLKKNPLNTVKRMLSSKINDQRKYSRSPRALAREWE